MSVMVWAYTRMSSALRGHAIGECTYHQMQIVRAKRKVSHSFTAKIIKRKNETNLKWLTTFKNFFFINNTS